MLSFGSLNTFMIPDLKTLSANPVSIHSETVYIDFFPKYGLTFPFLFTSHDFFVEN